MTRFGFAVIVLSLWAMPVMAQQSIDSLCGRLSDFVPIDGVDFQPGATAVPADLNAIQDPVLGSISIPIEIDLAEFFDRDDLRNIRGAQFEPDISNIEINQDGAVFYNGQEITADIQRVCGTPVPEEKNVVVESPPPTPKTKPPTPIKAEENKSRVKVFNGNESVLSGEAEKPIEPAPKPVAKEVPEKAEIADENAIDVEVLKAQDSKDEVINNDGDENSILEGQYP